MLNLHLEERFEEGQIVIKNSMDFVLYEVLIHYPDSHFISTRQVHDGQEKLISTTCTLGFSCPVKVIHEAPEAYYKRMHMPKCLAQYLEREKL